MNIYIFLIAGFVAMSSSLPTEGRYRFFQSIGSTQYYIEDYLQANWELAFLICRKRGLHLVSLEQEQDQQRLKEYLSKNDLGNKTFWTSATDKDLDSWFWLDVGEPFKGDSFSSDSENQETHCLAIKEGTFYKTNCTLSNYFICEYRADPTLRYY
ncbi:killer cell lectin-like receptor subfamily F member 1 isoform X1 [Aethina tumida]|uniref:killer cell lectin-like receptor subfamily F member 1 isoform X1 n=1 Tax=Aethina tumida TaxID=116153 RepID=UPI0021492B52|nr:killer cell lectin-like receptor subfamily F member 1 isoform X1 [Aethina tumida]XP_049819136.1 killer cell lectin-like receptor subfamily F member 1 isoform X1 [Aethina tumida]XP_049819137.1 killer cell lectin-like receptor subfamily F member 1 isoform X1 [Aethina tumida]